MRTDYLLLILIPFLFGVELIYFRVANYFRIIDRPNERSSHFVPIVRGGGIIFFVAAVAWYLIVGSGEWMFIFAASLIAIVSFLDDVITVSPLLRLIIQTLSLLLIAFQLSLFEWPWYLTVAAIIISVGALNAFNFMDGINGITAVYGLVTLVSFAVVFLQKFQHSEYVSLIYSIIASIGVFLFFNFRTRARCFAGDVGSVTLAFLQIFLLLGLIRLTGNFAYALFFLVFGVDTTATIVYRIRQRENIFQAHRSHLYQLFANEMRHSHLTVSVVYGVVQGLVNTIVIWFCDEFNFLCSALIVAAFGVYLMMRERVLHRLGKPGIL